MPKLSDDNWKEIDARIKTATNIRWAHGLKNWGAAGAFATACVAVAIFVVTQISGNSKFQGTTEEHFRGIELQLVSLRALIAANQPLKKQNQDAAKQLLAQAKQKRIPPIPEDTLKQAGGNFIDASAQDQGAWKVALDFLNYRSSINPGQPLYLGQTLTKDQSEELNHFDWNVPPGRPSPGPMLQSKQRVPLDQSVRFERIGHPTRQDAPDGAAAMFVIGGALNLDGFYVRGVVFEGVEVHYSGGPVILDGVFFINCTFVIDNDFDGRALAEVILASPEVKFKT